MCCKHDTVSGSGVHMRIPAPDGALAEPNTIRSAIDPLSAVSQATHPGLAVSQRHSGPALGFREGISIVIKPPHKHTRTRAHTR